MVERPACSCLICCSRVSISCSRVFSSASRTATSFCARSSDSRVVSPSFPQLLLALQVLPRQLQRGARLLDRGARLLQRRSRGGNARFTALQLAFERLGIDLEQELAGVDALAFLHGEPGDAAHRVGGDVDLPLRLDLARRRDDRLEVAPAQRFDGHGWHIRRAPEVGRPRGGAGEQQSSGDETPVRRVTLFLRRAPSRPPVSRPGRCTRPGT